MLETRAVADGTLELQWLTDGSGRVLYRLYEVMKTGQYRLVSTYDRGPFDTALEVAQWAWRNIAREVPPAAPVG